MERRATLPVVLRSIVVALLRTALAAPAGAICLGCPPVAWDADVTLRDDTVHRGWFLLSGFLVADRLDFASGPPTPEWRAWAPETLRLWTSAATPRHAVRGHRLDAWDPEAEPVPAIVTLPATSIVLIGAPVEVATAEVVTIEDRSIAEGHFEVQAPAFFVAESQAARLAEPPTTAFEVNFGETTIYCFWHRDPPPLAERRESCREELAYTAYDVMAGSGGVKSDPAPDAPIVLVVRGGT